MNKYQQDTFKPQRKLSYNENGMSMQQKKNG